MIEFLSLNYIHREVGTEISEAIGRVLASDRYVLGPEVEAFEEELANHEGARYAVGVGNGLDALALSLRAAGVGPGDEVIVPSNTFVATWLAVALVGADPVPVEPNRETQNLDIAGLEGAVGPRTSAVVPVHLYGQPAQMDEVVTVASRHGLAVIADGAQSIGARFRDRPVAQWADATTLSFYPGKNLGALGDGGAVLTDDRGFADRLRLLRNYGSRQKYIHEMAGVNSRLDELQAAVLRVKLRKLDGWTSRRRTLAGAYGRLLPADQLEIPRVANGAEPVWHLYVVRHRARDALAEHLRIRGVQTLIHYPVPPHRQKAFAAAGWKLPVADDLASSVLSLPIGPHMSDDDCRAVADAVREFS